MEQKHAFQDFADEEEEFKRQLAKFEQGNYSDLPDEINNRFGNLHIEEEKEDSNQIQEKPELIDQIQEVPLKPFGVIPDGNQIMEKPERIDDNDNQIQEKNAPSINPYT